MGRPVLTGSILEVSNMGRASGGVIMNVWHYKLSVPTAVILDGDAIVDAAEVTLAPGIGDGLLARMKAISNEATIWEKVRFQWIYPVRYSPTDDFSQAGAGSVIGQPLPMNVNGVLTLKGELAGPAGRGRKHFGGLSVSDVSGSSVTPQFVTAAEQVAELMVDIVDLGALAAGANLIPVILHRDAPEQSEPWGAYNVETTSRVLRRRTLGVGI